MNKHLEHANSMPLYHEQTARLEWDTLLRRYNHLLNIKTILGCSTKLDRNQFKQGNI